MQRSHPSAMKRANLTKLGATPAVTARGLAAGCDGSDPVCPKTDGVVQSHSVTPALVVPSRPRPGLLAGLQRRRPGRRRDAQSGRGAEATDEGGPTVRVSAGPDILVVRDAAVGLRALGLVMLASGGTVAGALLAAGGLLLAVRPRVHTAVFDLTAGTLLLRSRGVFGADTAAIPLGEVASVDVDETADSDGDAVHVLVVRLRDGSTRPLVPSLCSRAEMHRATSAICRFLELPLHAPAGFHLSAAELRFLAWLLRAAVVLDLGFLGAGVYARRQQQVGAAGTTAAGPASTGPAELVFSSILMLAVIGLLAALLREHEVDDVG